MSKRCCRDGGDEWKEKGPAAVDPSGGCNSPGTAGGCHSSNVKGGCIFGQAFPPSSSKLVQLYGYKRRTPGLFGTRGDINKGEGMKKKTKHPFALL